MNSNERVGYIEEYIQELEIAYDGIEPTLYYTDTSENKENLLRAQRIIKDVIESNKDVLEDIQLTESLNDE